MKWVCCVAESAASAPFSHAAANQRSPRHGAHQRTRRALSAMIKHIHFNFREDTNSKFMERCVYQPGKLGNKRDQSFRPETMLERTFLRPTVRAMASERRLLPRGHLGPQMQRQLATLLCSVARRLLKVCFPLRSDVVVSRAPTIIITCVQQTNL